MAATPRAVRVTQLASAALWFALGVAPAVQPRAVKDFAAALAAADPVSRARAACALKKEGDLAVEAVTPLVHLLADASPVDRAVCEQHWGWHGDPLTTPGELAAAALVSIGSRAFDPVLSALKDSRWVARRNAAWTLGALNDSRAAKALIEALKDAEADVREQAAWALGALGEEIATDALAGALKDPHPAVRRQAAWALGAIGDARATDSLIAALKDTDAGVRKQAAWAIGAIGK